MRIRAVAATGVVLSVLVAGCGATPDVGRAQPPGGAAAERRAPVPGPTFAGTSQGRACQVPGLRQNPVQRLPEHADVAAVTLCTDGYERLRGRGEWRVRRTTQLRAAEVRSLVAGLRTPDRGGDGICPAIGYIYPSFVLTLRDGRHVAARIPQDGCEPLERVRTLLNGAMERPGAEVTPLEQLRSEGATRAGCETYVKGVPPEPGGVAPAAPPRGIKVGVCRYDGDNQHELRLTATGTASGATIGEVLRAVRPDSETQCAEVLQGSLELLPAGGRHGGLQVETGGCHRVLNDEWRVIGHLPPSNVRQLVSLAAHRD